MRTSLSALPAAVPWYPQVHARGGAPGWWPADKTGVLARLSNNAGTHQHMVLEFLHVPEANLYKSEPPPQWFGNPGNASDATWTNANWLKSRFHFSFAEYRNPKNTQFGCLRVMNDDLVQGERGFGEHPHRDVEIVTYIVDGELTHGDSMSRGDRQTLGRGSVQFMTAGTGISHSEHNLQDSPLRFIQIWITPHSRDLAPAYGGFDGTTADAIAARKNKLAQLAGDARVTSSTAPIRLQQDCSLYVSELEPSQQVTLRLGHGRQAYVLCVEGTLTVGDAISSSAASLAMERHDAAEVRGEGELCLTSSADGPAHVLLLEMAAGPGGRGPGTWPMHLG